MKTRKSITIVFGLIIGIFILSNIFFIPAPAAENEQIAIICNNSISAGSMTKKELKALYDGKKSKVGNDPVTLLALKEGDVHKKFVKQYLKKSEIQFKRYWKNKVFSGSGTPPKAFQSEKGLIENVSRTEGSIGYVSANVAQKFCLIQRDKARVKIVSITE